MPPSPALPALPDLEVDLVVRFVPYADIRLEQPFTMAFELTLSGLLPSPAKTRLVYLVIQHLQPPRAPASPPAAGAPPTHLRGASPRPAPSLSSPPPPPHHPPAPESASPTMSPRRNGVFNFGPAYTESPLAAPPDAHSPMRLPPPFAASAASRSVLSLGPSVRALPPIALARSADPGAARGEAVHAFECTFVPVRKGFVAVGGMRVLVVGDREVDAGRAGELGGVPHAGAGATVLREWDVVGEVWVAK